MTRGDVEVPLLLQPANPPLPFVGRTAEGARLTAAIGRGPVVIVCGFSGVGKSGLLASVLATSFPAARAHALVVDAKENVDVVGSVLRRLEQLLGARFPKALATADRSGQASGDARLLVDAIEEGALWLIVENLERIDDISGLREVVSFAERFCRRARLLCVCREDPRIPSLVPQTIAVDPMSTLELRALLESVQPGLSDAEASDLVGHAKGSPWRLLQLSLGGIVDDAGPEKSLLMLSPIAAGLLRTLALVPSSVPLDTLARATRMPTAAVIDSLARRGYLEASARGLRLHDAARPLVDALFDVDERAQRTQKLLRAIAVDGSADVSLAALDLMRRAPDETALLAMLEKHGETLRFGGHAQLLLDALGPTARRPAGQVASPEIFDAWRCRLALDVGGDVLARLGLPGERRDASEPSSVVLHAAVLAARGDLARACGMASTVATARHNEAGDRLRALELLLHCRDEAVDRDLLTRVKPVSDADRVRRDALSWYARSLDSRSEPALSTGGDLEVGSPDEAASMVRLYEGLPKLDQRELAAVVARGLRSMGHPWASASVLALVAGSRAAMSTTSGRDAELERGETSLALGELDAAQAAFHRLASMTAAPQRLDARLGELAVRLVVGNLGGFAAELAAAVSAVQERELPPARMRAVARLSSSFASLMGRGPPRHREIASLATARKLRGRALDAGLAIRALEAGLVCIDAAIIARDHASVAVEGERVALASERVGSRRFALEARFASLAATSARSGEDGREPRSAEPGAAGGMSSTVLVELARAVDVSPVVARRAAALLGEDVLLDEADRAVVAALSGSASARPHILRQAAGPEWTVDAVAMRIILVDGRTVDLSHRKVLFDLLASLCLNGGAATKEQLLEKAWGVREYHPLQHDNRLKVAVRKLRRLLEEVLGDDPIEAAADGYRLRGKVRFLE